MDNYNNQNFEYNPSGAAGYYDNSGYYGGGAAPPQMQGQYYQAQGVDPNAYYAQDQYNYPRAEGWVQPQGSNDWASQMGPEAATRAGSYYFHSEFTPQIFGFPVTALAYDSTYEAMYISSSTQSITSTRWRSQRASMLAVHNTVDGMCYASVGGHGEAEAQTLQQVYNCMYGIEKTVPMPPSKIHIPPHAYRPPYGGSQVDLSMAHGGGKHGHLGISSILPLSNGYAATISPAAVRVHSHGGLQVNDRAIEGMLCGTIHPHSEIGAATHISVGGLHVGSKYANHEIFCMDVWQGLRVVNSWAFNSKYKGKTGVTAMATCHERGSIVAGCSDGNMRILDGSLRNVATVKSHAGGISSMSVSPDGMLIATTGYSSRVAPGKETSVLYGFPDPSVYIYDIRYLGRGGMPHMFSGARGCPCHVSFVPDVENLPSNRLLAASGQPGGGLQIIVPFQEANDNTADFFAPQLGQGEFMSAMSTSEDNLAFGTSKGRVLQYRLKGYKSSLENNMLSASSPAFVPSASKSPTRGSTGHQSVGNKKEPLEMSKLFMQPMPGFSIDPKLLLKNGDPGIRNGNDEKAKSLFSTYVLQTNPTLSSFGYSKEDGIMSFGPIGGKPIVTSGNKTVAQSLLKEAAIGERDFLLTIPTSKLNIDVLSNFGTTKKEKKLPPKMNPNKFLNCSNLESICYEAGVNGKRMARQRGQINQGSDDIPARYRRQVRPSFKAAGAFDPTECNNTGLFPGWDYSSTMPNAFATPVVLLLYFIPEIRSTVMGAQYNEKLFSPKGYEKALSPELGFVFHQIETLYSNALLHPTKGNSPLRPRIGVWAPSNFLTALGTMPEAEQLQILDGSPAAVDPPRRSEAFYRFLAYQLDKEVSKNSEKKLMDSMNGLDFMSVNQFVSETSLSSQSTTRALTVDLAYDAFSRDAEKKTSIRFGSLLQHSLCRETRLRAWNKKSKAYETIVQRKIAVSLPEILTLSCACAGRKDEDGLWMWRMDDGAGPWLPEIVEVELLEDGHVSVREMAFNNDGNVEEVWASKKRSKLPQALSELVNGASTRQKYRYRLDAVLSYVNDNTEGGGDDEHYGHHILHARIPQEYKRRVLQTQQDEANKMAANENDPSKIVMSSSVLPETFLKRAVSAEKKLKSMKESDNDWVLYNGFAVTNTVSEDARAFHVSFKEPCLVVYRAIGDSDAEKPCDKPPCVIPQQVMNARSLSSATSRNTNDFDLGKIEKGKLVAFDAEFVSVQEEEAILTDSGAKVVIRETRHAIGRISVIDCESRKIILDDHVLPREDVVDYLTRFSGIVAEDLDTLKSPHNLISTRSAYLKLRYLMEQGCIFLGHGLKLDFANVNLTVPPNQVVDTVEIFHQPGMRYISLRFLANYVLKRDMQQDIHDSVEDALTAFELYEKALEWKQQGIFEKKLQEIYSYGTQTEWKLGVDKLK